MLKESHLLHSLHLYQGVDMFIAKGFAQPPSSSRTGGFKFGQRLQAGWWRSAITCHADHEQIKVLKFKQRWR